MAVIASFQVRFSRPGFFCTFFHLLFLCFADWDFDQAKKVNTFPFLGGLPALHWRLASLLRVLAGTDEGEGKGFVFFPMIINLLHYSTIIISIFSVFVQNRQKTPKNAKKRHIAPKITVFTRKCCKIIMCDCI